METLSRKSSSTTTSKDTARRNVSQRNFGEHCPICDFASQLWRDGTETNDEETKKLAKSLFVRTRYFSPVVVRGMEEEGVKVYGYGKQAYELLLGYILDPEYGDITDPLVAPILLSHTPSHITRRIPQD